MDRVEPSEKLLAQVTDRVHLRMPAATREEVAELVAGLFVAFADSRVRDFVPIFVERDAVDELRQRQGLPRHRTPQLLRLEDSNGVPVRILEPS